MKLYRHWAAAEKSITDAEGNRLRLRKWGRSNASAGAAENSAHSKVGEIATRLMRKADIHSSISTDRNMAPGLRQDDKPRMKEIFIRGRFIATPTF